MHSLLEDLKNHGYSKELKYLAFSDTIIISLPVGKRHTGSDRGRNPSWWTLNLVGELLIRLFRRSIVRQFYFRGCLSIGKFFRFDNMIIGPTVDEAAEYYTLPEWSGISTSPSASKILTDTEEMRASSYDFFIQYDIPIKGMAERSGWALNWAKDRASSEIPNENLRQILYEESRKDNGIPAYFKIRNTLDFYDQVNKKNTN